MNFTIESPYPPEECLRRLDASFAVKLTPLRQMMPKRRVNGGDDRKVAGRIDRDTFVAMMVGRGNRSLFAPAEERVGLLDPSITGQLVATLHGTRLVGEVHLVTRATVVSLATAALGMAFAVLFFSFVLGDVYSPLQVRVYAAGLGALGLASYVLWVLNTRKSALREAAELQGILTVALTSEPDSGWWEKG